MLFALLAKPTYLEERSRLPKPIQAKVVKCENFLASDPRHPGLRTKLVQSKNGIFEARVDQSYRILYARDQAVLQLLKVGVHEILDAPVSRPSPLPSVRQISTDRGPTQRGVEPARGFRHHEAGTVAPPSTPLPREITDVLLAEAGVPESSHKALRACRTEEQLLDCGAEGSELVLEVLFPKAVDEVQQEPDLIVEEVEDLQRHSDGDLLGFLLRLDEEQQAAACRGSAGPALIKGGPGSGKSTVALYRIRHLLEQASGSGSAPRILFATFAASLAEYTRALLAALLGEQAGLVEVTTLDEIAARLVAEAGEVPDLVLGKSHQRLVQAVLRDPALPDTARALGAEYLAQEFEWVIEGRAIGSIEEYLQADRRGRGRPLGGAARAAVWQVYERYAATMIQGNQAARPKLYRLALEHLSSNAPRRWDHVIVDEAQDLPPVALKLAIELAGPLRSVVFAADACQSIYNRCFRFSHLHDEVDFRGRSTVLRCNYRSTRQIAEATAELIRGTASEDSDLLLESARFEGSTPVLHRVGKEDEQVKELADVLRSQRRDHRLSWNSMAVLCPDERSAAWAVELLGKEGVPCVRARPHSLDLDSNEVKVLTLASVKGLEFPSVSLLRVEEGFLPALLSSDSDDLEDHIEEQRRLLYVGATRAMRHLHVFTARRKPSRFLEGISPERWSQPAAESGR
jgi:superfamily I DNA/RNA helicase/mRNA-degrading endonuclease RelE of RelBE toxin-antitoxin system